MNLNSKYWSYCKEIGVMKEKYSKEKALEAIKKSVSAEVTADPAFKAIVSGLTLNSPQVSVRACMLYKYDINLTYVVGGNIKHGTISEYGQSGVKNALHITDWSGEGEYTVCKNFDALPYTLYNDNNIFTYDEMKNALKGVIDKRVPQGTTSYESTDWSVSCYVVPVLVVLIDHNGKTYQMAHNLQNGYYHWEYPNDPALYAQGKKTGLINALLKVGGVALAILGLIISAGSEAFNWLTIVGLLITGFVAYKTKQPKNHFKNYFVNHPGANMVKPLITAIIVAVLGFVTFIIGL